MIALPAIPNERTLISYSLRSVDESPRKQWITVCEYPDCQREFDGKTWKVTKDYRKEK